MRPAALSRASQFLSNPTRALLMAVTAARCRRVPVVSATAPAACPVPVTLFAANASGPAPCAANLGSGSSTYGNSNGYGTSCSSTSTSCLPAGGAFLSFTSPAPPSSSSRDPIPPPPSSSHPSDPLPSKERNSSGRSGSGGGEEPQWHGSESGKHPDLMLNNLLLCGLALGGGTYCAWAAAKRRKQQLPLSEDRALAAARLEGAVEITSAYFFAELVPQRAVSHVEVCGDSIVKVKVSATAPTYLLPPDDKKEYFFYIASAQAFEDAYLVAQRKGGADPPVTVVKHVSSGAQATAKTGSPVNEFGAAGPAIIGVTLLLFLLASRGRMLVSSSGVPGSGGAADPMKAFRVGRANPITSKDLTLAPPVTFADVAGLRDAKKEVTEFVDFLRNPNKYERLGAQVPKGALLVGPPGTGKTLLARAVAGEAQVPFFSMSGSDFMEVFVGVGPSRVRDLFAQARRASPSIVFIDEIDGVGRRRQKGSFGGGGGANDERESTLNQLLVELDGFMPGTNVLVLAGTNRPDVLDPALTRPGRFDRTIRIEKPDLEERVDIFERHMRPLLLEDSLNPDEMRRRLAALTPGFSGADIRNVCNEAAIYAARRNAAAVGVRDFERACERVIGGIERTTSFLAPAVRDTVAWHEAGHAVAGWFLPRADPVVKVSIVPRMNGALGFAQNLPEEVPLMPKEQICDQIGVLLGGRAAEEIAQHTTTTGAYSDLEKATRLAYAYASSWGFSQKLGLRSFPAGGGLDETGGGTALYKPYSDDLAKAIDDEAGHLLESQYARVKALLSAKFPLVRALANRLKEKETLAYSDLVEVLGARPYPMREEYAKYIAADGGHATVAAAQVDATADVCPAA